MNKKLQMETLAFVLLLAAFPITSWGTTRGSYLVWVIGFICLIAGGLLPVITRYMDHSTDKIRDTGMEYDERTS